MPISKFDPETNTLVVDQEGYPELEGVEVGADISGKWTGKVTDVAEDGKITIEYEKQEFELENHADKALDGMMGGKGGKSVLSPDREEDD